MRVCVCVCARAHVCACMWVCVCVWARMSNKTTIKMNNDILMWPFSLAQTRKLKLYRCVVIISILNVTTDILYYTVTFSHLYSVLIDINSVYV